MVLLPFARMVPASISLGTAACRMEDAENFFEPAGPLTSMLGRCASEVGTTSSVSPKSESMVMFIVSFEGGVLKAHGLGAMHQPYRDTDKVALNLAQRLR